VPSFTFLEHGGDFRFLQIAFGYVLGRILVVLILLPLFFRGQPFTSYEVLQERFGAASRRATAGLFLITRNVSDALRLLLTALALQQVFGWSIASCVILLGVVTITYTFFGGVKSVIWNDCIQFVIYILGALATLWMIVSFLPGGWGQLVEYGQQHGKFRLLDFDLNVCKPTMTFWGGLVGGIFLTAATHGTDQLMVQRYLSAKNQTSASVAVVLSGLVVLAQFALFLLIGVGLACYYASFPPTVAFSSTDGDRVFAHFIVHHLGPGLTGITLAAVFAAAMSTLSSSLNSSATTLINDLVLPLSRRSLGTPEQLVLSRLATVFFGFVQIAIALLSYQVGTSENTIGRVLALAGYTLGPLLGLFLLAVLTQRVQQRAALAGFAVGIGILTYVARQTSLHWSWYAALGATLTFTAGVLFSKFLGESSPTAKPPEACS
jgi:SSS family transporter